MRLLADQDVYGATVSLLRDAGHDVVTAAELGLGQSDDVELLRAAQAGHRILLTRDRDYGTLVFQQAMGTGVIYLRMLPSNVRSVHDELLRVLRRYREQELLQVFLVVEPARHRLRKTP